MYIYVCTYRLMWHYIAVVRGRWGLLQRVTSIWCT